MRYALVVVFILGLVALGASGAMAHHDPVSENETYQGATVYNDDDPRLDDNGAPKTGVIVEHGGDVLGIRSVEQFVAWQAQRQTLKEQRKAWEERLEGEYVWINPPGMWPKTVPALSSGLPTVDLERKTGIDAPWTDYEPA